MLSADRGDEREIVRKFIRSADIAERPGTPPELPVTVNPMAAPAPKPRRQYSEAQRSKILDNTLFPMASTGMVRIETRTPTWAVVMSGHRVNTVAHLLATVFLCGLWLPVWIIAEATGGEYRRTISVDEWGQVHDSQKRPKNNEGPSPRKIIAVIAGGMVTFIAIVLILGHFA